jgi:hypothetical protein
MSETPEISPEPPPDSGIDAIAALLAEQIAASHEAAARCFAIAADDEDFGPGAQSDALKIATRLMQASATAASAINRLRGGQFHHCITVRREIDTQARNAARRERYRLAREADQSPGALLQCALDADVRNSVEAMAAKCSQSAQEPAENKA